VSRHPPFHGWKPPSQLLSALPIPRCRRHSFVSHWWGFAPRANPLSPPRGNRPSPHPQRSRTQRSTAHRHGSPRSKRRGGHGSKPLLLFAARIPLSNQCRRMRTCARTTSGIIASCEFSRLTTEWKSCTRSNSRTLAPELERPLPISLWSHRMRSFATATSNAKCVFIRFVFPITCIPSVVLRRHDLAHEWCHAKSNSISRYCSIQPNAPAYAYEMTRPAIATL
jgi:hypothetical protein